MNKKALLQLFLFAGLSLLSADALAQKTIKVSGRILDEAGLPLPGATVSEDGTTNGAISDLDGKFCISVAGTAILNFECMGYAKVTESVRGRREITVSLNPDNTFLEEAVVVGYGTMKRSDLTGSVSSVSAKNLENFRSSGVLAALGGQVAGVSITSSDGAPGSGFNILVRGVGTVNGDSAPLYIVDGFEVADIDYLAQQDIFSIEILKDASASAIYGSRAANGVVLVTTKSGSEGKTTISYNGSATFSTLAKHLDVLSTYDYVNLQHELNSANDGSYFRTGENEEGIPYKYQSMLDYKKVPGINWQDEAFRNTWSQNHDVSISGGSKSHKYNASFSHYGENGIFVNSGYKKTSARIKSNNKITDWLTADVNINFTNQKKYGMGTSGYVLRNILQYRPTGGLNTSDEELLHSAYDPDDDNSYNDHFNPVSAAWTTDNVTETKTWMANGALNFKINKYLKLKIAGSYAQYNIRQDQFYYAESQNAKRQGGAYGQSKSQENLRLTNSNVLTYDRKFRKVHKLNLTLGQEYSYQSSRYLLGQAKEFPVDVLGVNQLSVGTPSVVETSLSDKTRLSFFGRGFYSYSDKYMLTATVRADASSVFAKKNRWGFFPSFAAAWTISNEPWMKSCRDIVSNLKLRAGWGVVGNDRISSYLSSEIYTTVKYGLGSTTVPALEPRQLENPDIRWEGASTVNAGIDLGFFKSRIKLTADAFIKDTKDLLMAQNLAMVTGWSSQWQNVGKIRNMGLELTLNTLNFDRKNFSWTTDLNISFIKNTLVSLLSGADYMYARSGFDSNNTNNDYIAVVGEPLGNMFGYVFDGIYQYSDFVMNPDQTISLKPGVVNANDHAGQAMAPGWVKYKDLDGNNKITTADRAIIGNGYPKWYGGFTNSFHIYGFDASFMFQFSYGNDVFNVTRFMTTKTANSSRNMLAETLDRWTPYHASNCVPSAKGYTMHDIYSRFIEDGSYLRLKNLTIGYSLPLKLISRLRLSKLRVYLSGANLFCLTNYSGYDPEVNSSSSPLMPGIDNSCYPKSRTFIAGIEIKL